MVMLNWDLLTFCFETFDYNFNKSYLVIWLIAKELQKKSYKSSGQNINIIILLLRQR